MKGNDFSTGIVCHCTNNPNKQHISFRNLLNQIETREYDILSCNRKANAGLAYIAKI